MIEFVIMAGVVSAAIGLLLLLLSTLPDKVADGADVRLRPPTGLRVKQR